MSASTPARSLAFVFASLLLLAPASAQELQRTPLTPTKTQAPQIPKGLTVPAPGPISPTVQEGNLDDLPDYCPMEDVRDKIGNIIEVKRVGNPYVLDFTNGSYTPTRGIDPDLRKTLQTDKKGYTYGFVMIRGRMADQKMDRLRGMGLQLLGVHTWQSVKAKIPATALAELENLEWVQWVGYARTKQKIEINMWAPLVEAPNDQVFDVVINPFDSDWGKQSKKVPISKGHGWRPLGQGRASTADGFRFDSNGPYHEALEEMGIGIETYQPLLHGFEARATKAQVLKLLELDWIHTVELHLRGEAAHDQAMAMTRQDTIRGPFPGKGVPVGVIDTGIDGSPLHNDLNPKGWHGYSSVSGQAWNADGHGHGTHVTGTVAGDGSTDARYKGAAPDVGKYPYTSNALLWIGRYLNNSGSGSGSITSVYAFMASDWKVGSTTYPKPWIVSNSWGATTSVGWTGTDSGSRNADIYTYTYKQTYVFCVGNKKATRWAWSPGAAKNVLAVGAVRDWWSGTSLTDRQGELASFYCYGTKDGRQKPEVVAPGNITTSCKINSTTAYTNMSGCSMATPLVSGMAASRADQNSWFKDKPQNMKALLVAGATNRGVLYSSSTSGWGLVNAYKSMYASSVSTYWQYGGWSDNSFNSSGDSTYVTIAVPSNIVWARAVLTWTEEAASSSATKARVCDIRAYIDAPPYTSNNSSGDYTLFSSVNNCITYTSSTMANAIKGKTIRFKIHAASIPSGYHARPAIVLFVYYKDPYASTNDPTLSTAVTDEYVQPNQLMYLTGTLKSQTTGDMFTNARMWLNTSASVSRLYRRTEDSVGQYFYSTTSYPSSPYPRVLWGTSGGMVLGSGTVRSLEFRFPAPNTNGTKCYQVAANWHRVSSSAVRTWWECFCVDNQIPNTITGLTSTSHTVGMWSNDKTISFKWNTATDVGCAGVDYLAWQTTTSSSYSPTIKDGNATVTTHTTASLADSSTGYYFHIRSRDKVPNYGNVAKVGPFKIDTVPPVISSVTLDNGATYNASTFVNVKVSASDNASGLTHIWYAGNKATGWMTYSSNRNLAWSSLFTSLTPGTKTVTVWVRDAAGNISSPKSDSIIYTAIPIISTVSSLNYNATKGAYVITGTNFQYVNQVLFGSYTITKKWTSAHEDDWYAGRWRYVNPTTIYLYPPQARTPGTYSVRVRNLAGVLSNLKTTSYSAWTSGSPFMLTQTAVTVGKAQYVVCARGTLPAASVQITMFSTRLKPSSIPGVIAMGIGDNWSEYFLLPTVGFNSTTRCSVVGGIVPAFAKGFSAYFQTAFFKPSLLPGTASGIWKTTYK